MFSYLRAHAQYSHLSNPFNAEFIAAQAQQAQNKTKKSFSIQNEAINLNNIRTCCISPHRKNSTQNLMTPLISASIYACLLLNEIHTYNDSIHIHTTIPYVNSKCNHYENQLLAPKIQLSSKTSTPSHSTR